MIVLVFDLLCWFGHIVWLWIAVSVVLIVLLFVCVCCEFGVVIAFMFGV